jgi:hypothetical protein
MKVLASRPGGNGVRSTGSIYQCRWLKEIMVQGETGYMAEVGDINAWRLRHEILGRGTIERFKSTCRAHAKKFDISNIGTHYEKLYERFL